MTPIPFLYALSALYPADDPDLGMVEIVKVEPAKLPPEVPPPVWDNRPIDADRAMAAVRAMCA